MAYDCVFIAIFLNHKNSKSQAVCVDGVSLGHCRVSAPHHYFSLIPTAASRTCFVTQNITVTKRSPLPCSLYLCIYLSVFTPSLQRLLISSPPCPVSLMHPSLPPTLLSLLCLVGWRFLSLTANSKCPFREQWMKTYLNYLLSQA